MELDPRIKDRRHIFDCFSIDEANKYIGKECYITDSLADFWNLESIRPRTLTKIEVTNNGRLVLYCCNSDFKSKYTYCLPVELVTPKEKRFRPFKDTDEFFIKTNFEKGDLIHIRSKDKLEYWVMLVGWTENGIMLGTEDFTFEKLFENFELWDGEENFKPFGVEE